MSFTVSSYFKFAFALKFYQGGNEHQYQKNWCERIGDVLRKPVGTFLDITLREIRNPLTIVALGALAAFAVTIAFYPIAGWSTVVHVVPILSSIKPWMVKFALYIICQTTILGMTLRTVGRLSNPELCDAWKAGQLIPVFHGSVPIRA